MLFNSARRYFSSMPTRNWFDVSIFLSLELSVALPLSIYICSVIKPPTVYGFIFGWVWYVHRNLQGQMFLRGYRSWPVFESMLRWLFSDGGPSLSGARNSHQIWCGGGRISSTGVKNCFMTRLPPFRKSFQFLDRNQALRRKVLTGRPGKSYDPVLGGERLSQRMYWRFLPTSIVLGLLQCHHICCLMPTSQLVKRKHERAAQHFTVGTINHDLVAMRKRIGVAFCSRIDLRRTGYCYTFTGVYALRQKCRFAAG